MSVHSSVGAKSLLSLEGKALRSQVVHPPSTGLINLNETDDHEIELRPLTREDAEKFIRYLRMIEKQFNSYIAKKRNDLGQPIPLRMNVSRLVAKVREAQETDFEEIDSHLSSAIRWYNERTPRGRFYHTQIRTFIDIVCSVANKGANRISVGSDKQFGKTGLLAALFLIEPLVLDLLTPGYRLRPNSIYVPLLVGPNQKTLEGQMQEEARRFIYLHEHIVFENIHTGEKASSSSFLEKKLHLSHETQYNSSIYEYMMRNSVIKWTGDKSDNIGAIRRIEKIKSRGQRVLLLFDESHYATNRGGTFDNAAGEMIRNTEIEDCYLQGLSATPYETLDGFLYIPMWYDVGYCGGAFFNGELLPCIDPNFIAQPPQLVSYMQAFGFPEIIPKTYCSMEEYCVLIKNKSRGEAITMAANAGYSLRKEYEAHKKSMVQQIAQLVNGCIFSKSIFGKITNYNGIDLSDPCGRGMLMRLSNITNEAAREIINQVEAYIVANFPENHPLRNLKFIPYMDDTSEMMLERLISKEAGEDGHYVLFTVAGARMGTQVPNHCTYFFDTTRNFSTTTAEQQGLWGRAHGYGKRSIVFVSDANFKEIVYYIESKGDTRRKASTRALRADGHDRGNPKKTVAIAYAKNFEGIADEDFINLENYINEIGFKGKSQWYAKSKNEADKYKGLAFNFKDGGREGMWEIVAPIILKAQQNTDRLALARNSRPGTMKGCKLLHFTLDKDIRKKEQSKIKSGEPSLYFDAKNKKFYSDRPRSRHVDAGRDSIRGKRESNRAGMQYEDESKSNAHDSTGAHALQVWNYYDPISGRHKVLALSLVLREDFNTREASNGGPRRYKAHPAKSVYSTEGDENGK